MTKCNAFTGSAMKGLRRNKFSV